MKYTLVGMCQSRCRVSGKRNLWGYRVATTSVPSTGIRNWCLSFVLFGHCHCANGTLFFGLVNQVLTNID